MPTSKPDSGEEGVEGADIVTGLRHFLLSLKCRDRKSRCDFTVRRYFGPNWDKVGCLVFNEPARVNAFAT